MKFRSLIVCLTLLVACVPAFAWTMLQKVTPQWTKENGVTVKMERREDGTIDFTVTRYLNIAPVWENDPELTTHRTAYLELRDAESKKLISAKRTTGETKNDTVVYQFARSPEAIPSTRFSLWECPECKDPANPRSAIMQTGGDSIYEFDLSEFAAPLLKPDQH